MDPNANLEEQERLLTTKPQTHEPRTRDARLRELRAAMFQWLAGGGFEPDWTKAPRARRYYFNRP